MEPESKPACPKLNKLVLLDVNGILCKKIKPGTKSDITNLKPINLKNYQLYIRPGAFRFVKNLIRDYQVGIFSSTTYQNLTTILQLILNDKLMKQLAFIADRRQTRLDPGFGINPTIKEYQTIKLLQDIWDNPVFNHHRTWNRSNTILIDHEYCKLRFNQFDNILICHEWDGSSQAESFQELTKMIELKFQDLSDMY